MPHLTTPSGLWDTCTCTNCPDTTQQLLGVIADSTSASSKVNERWCVWNICTFTMNPVRRLKWYFEFCHVEMSWLCTFNDNSLCTISVNMHIVSHSQMKETGSFGCSVVECTVPGDLLSFTVAASQFYTMFYSLIWLFFSCLVLSECFWTTNEGCRSAHFNVNLEFCLFLFWKLLGFICNESVPQNQ